MLFNYKAMREDGSVTVGTYDAEEKVQVVSYIKANGWIPISVEVGAATTFKKLMEKVRPKPASKDMAVFCSQFSSLLHAGLTIVDTLDLLYKQTKNKVLREAIHKTILGISEGRSLGDSLEKSNDCFDYTFINLLRAGEASGSLESSLDRMAEKYRRDAKVKKAVKKASRYPIIVIAVAVAVIIVVLLVVIPKFAAMFEELEIEMPAITQAVIDASDWLKKRWYIALIIVVGCAIGIAIFISSEYGKKTTSWLALKLPGIRVFTVTSNAASIARTLSTLSAAGMGIVEILGLIANSLNNVFYREAMNEVKKDVTLGKPMGAKMSDPKFSWLFPSLLVHTVAVSDSFGDSSDSMSMTADYYDTELENATEALMSFIEPAMIIVLALMVAFIALAILMPIVTMYDQLGDVI